MTDRADRTADRESDPVIVERITVATPIEERVTVDRTVQAERPATADRAMNSDRAVERAAVDTHHEVGYRDEREEARARLKASVDALAERANLQVQMQKEPLKMLGGASAVGATAGALLGLVLGRQLRRTKKIYVDADSPDRDQKALIRAQKKEKGGQNVGGALVATIATLGFKILNDKVLTPRLEEAAHNLLDRAGQGGQKPTATRSAQSAATESAARPTGGQTHSASWTIGGQRPAPASTSTSATASFLKRDEGAEASDAARLGVPGGPSVPGTGSSIPVPVSTVEAKAKGSPIDPEEKANPNIR